MGLVPIVQIVTIDGVPDPLQQHRARHTNGDAPSSLRQPAVQHVYADIGDDDDDDDDISLPDVNSVTHQPSASHRAAQHP